MPSSLGPVARWPLHPLFGLSLGLILASSAGAEILGDLENMSLGVEHGVFVFALARVIAAASVLIEGLQTASEAAREAGDRHRWSRLATSRHLSLVAGIGLIAGSGAELVEETHLLALGTHHGTLLIGVLSVVLDLSHMLAGAGKLASVVGWKDVVRQLQSVPVDIAGALALMGTAGAEITWGNLDGLEVGHEHGLLLFGFGRTLEAVTRGLTEAEEVDEAERRVARKHS